MKLEFTHDQLVTLDKAIQQLPYYIAAPLLSDINKQIAEQQRAMDSPSNYGAIHDPIPNHNN